MKKVFFLLLALTCIGVSAPTDHVFSQTQSEAIEGEIV